MRWERRSAVVLMVGFLVVFAVGIGKGSHLDSDDTLYAEMARQMVVTGNWLDNQWSDHVLYEKPPLYLWTLAISGWFGDWSEAALRVPGTLFSLLTLGMLIALVRQLGGSWRQGVATAALVGVSYFFFMMTRRLMMDGPMLAMICVATYFLVRRSATWFGVFCGLAVMVKGAAAGPLIVALCVFGLWEKRLSWRELLKSAAIGLFVAAPWHVSQWIRHGTEFWSGYLGHHVVERASSQVVPGSSLAESVQMLMSHEPIIFLGAGLGFVVLVRRRFKDSVGRLGLCLLIGATLPILLSTTRLPHYWLPAIPALALLTVTAPPKNIWPHRLAATAIALVMIVSLLHDPLKVQVFWLNPNFGPAEKSIGETVHAHAADTDRVIAFNGMSNALTFYGRHRVEMVTDDPRFYAVQERVHMIRRADVLRWMDGGLAPPLDTEHRFVVVRHAGEKNEENADLNTVITALRQSAPTRALYRMDHGYRMLVNDKGLGEPIP